MPRNKPLGIQPDRSLLEAMAHAIREPGGESAGVAEEKEKTEP
jgi:hypothetical protein